MSLQQIENIHVVAEEPLLSPKLLKALYPISEHAIQTVLDGQTTIRNILTGKDPRLFIVVGPCSIHDTHSAKAYADKLQNLAKEVDDTLVIVMRVYFEKPRTRIGWQGFINDPNLDESYQIEAGLKQARELLLYVAEQGLPAAGEALDLVTPPYLQDLITWTAIGARTTESQSHRKMASGFSSPVGFKNGTDGNVDIAINAMHSAAYPNHFLSVNQAGDVAVIRTKGNPYTHIVLRGGQGEPNYQVEYIKHYENTLREANMPVNIMVDCSHDNSQKNYLNQPKVVQSVAEQINAGNQSIVALMLESNLNAGKQSITGNQTELKYGVSITDACMDWQMTEQLLLDFRDQIKDSIKNRRQGA